LANVPVVIVGEHLNALGTIRSLGGAGIPIYAVVGTRWCAAGLSRFAHVVRLPDLRGRVLVDGLKALALRLQARPVLILGGDQEVEVVNDARAELEPLYRFTLPPPELVRTLANKASFQRFAERRGLPVPRTRIVNAQDGAHGLPDLDLPWVIKPANKLLVLDGAAERAVRVDNPTQAAAALSRLVGAAGSVVVQEWIDGEDSDIYFALFVCDRASRIVAMFCGRKLVCSPPEVGSTGICTDAGEAGPEVARLARQFIDATGYRGIGSVEFKRDRRSGRFLIVEPTIGRTNWQQEVATLCGINLPLQAYLSECEQPAARETPAAPGTWAWSASLFHRRPRQTLADGVPIRDGYLQLRDPVPGLYHYLIEELARRAWRRMMRGLRGGGQARATTRKDHVGFRTHAK
jgi:predicted ATP-grasp superfamily ATP-dependent carboligase